MKNTFRQAMAWLHTWTGLLLGWVLFAVFLTGTAAYFRQEISIWMAPEVRVAGAVADPLTISRRALNELAPHADRWTIKLPDERSPAVMIQWSEAGSRQSSALFFDTRSEQFVQVRETKGGDFLYRFHYDLAVPNRWGEYVVGLAAMLMLVAIISGIVTHRRFFRDFFTFRRAKAAQRSWLDFHNVTGVLALPYHLMITYTGLLTLMFVYLPWGLSSVYADNEKAFFQDVYGNFIAPPAANQPATLAEFGPLLAEAKRRWGSVNVGRLFVYHPGDANALIEMRPGYEGQVSLNHNKIVFDGVSGEVRDDIRVDGSGVLTRAALIGLHVARFPEAPLRWIFFLSGLAGSVMVATGLVVWTIKRRNSLPSNEVLPVGLRCVERLNIGAIAGLTLAIAAYFWANRLLPMEVADRAALEIRVFFLAWLIAIFHSFIRPVMRAWREQLLAAAVLFGALPLLNVVVTDRHLFASVAEGDWLFAGFDIAMPVVGWMLLLAARAVGKPASSSTSVRSSSSMSDGDRAITE